MGSHEGTHGSFQTHDAENQSLVELVQTIDRQSRMSAKERQDQAEHILSFKTQRAFKTVERFAEHYKIVKEIGNGSFGSVKLGKHRKSDVPCAIKVIKKSSLKVAKVYQDLSKNELSVLEETVHPHITRVFELMEDQRNYYIIMELVSGGNLFDKITKFKTFTES